MTSPKTTILLSQTELDDKANRIADVLYQYQIGILTLVDLITGIKYNAVELDQVLGLLDPVSGLRYPATI